MKEENVDLLEELKEFDFGELLYDAVEWFFTESKPGRFISIVVIGLWIMITAPFTLTRGAYNLTRDFLGFLLELVGL